MSDDILVTTVGPATDDGYGNLTPGVPIVLAIKGQMANIPPGAFRSIREEMTQADWRCKVPAETVLTIDDVLTWKGEVYQITDAPPAPTLSAYRQLSLKRLIHS